MTPSNFGHFYDHVRRVLCQLRFDLKNGSSVDMAIAFALVSCQSYRVQIPEYREPYANHLKQLRLNQALQIALNYYEQPEVIADVGEHHAKIMREQWFFLLRELTAH